MKIKAIITATLLTFIVVSLAAMALKETRAAAEETKTAPSPVQVATAQQATESAPDTTPIAEAPETATPSHIAYYFHGSKRCATCNQIEKQSADTYETYFASQLENGELQWRVVNTDEPGNKHFVQDFQLSFQSVVLVEERNGEVVRWQNLADVWKWVRASPAEFEQSLMDATIQFMADGNPS